jgi:hypothetical protein
MGVYLSYKMGVYLSYKGLMRIRHFGFLSNRHRRLKLAIARQLSWPVRDN